LNFTSSRSRNFSSPCLVGPNSLMGCTQPTLD
jgi:hypothetical protein